jgi:hypothetical protein
MNSWRGVADFSMWMSEATTALVITNACGVNPKCTVEAGKVTRMGWLKVDDIRHRDPARAVTYKIITIINTVANTTKTSIDLGNMPESFTPPHTNADGTKVEFVTYTHRGQVHTTTV